jgi:KaiC/GvpD/RAD55 family RecA-like ATPase
MAQAINNFQGIENICLSDLPLPNLSNLSSEDKGLSACKRGTLSLQVVKMEEKRYGTFIKGFDNRLEGGIPKDHIVLIAGAAGTMKSSIAYHILHSNAGDNGTKGLYVSLEQSRKSLMKQMIKMGMDELPEERLAVLDLGMIKRNLSSLGENTWLKLIKMKIENLRKNMGYNMLVLDSLSAMETLADFEKPREELFEFFEWLRDLNITVFLILETESQKALMGNHGESFLTDGIITLDMNSVDTVDVQRRIRCVKMRGTDHATCYFNLMFKNKQFQITKSFMS